MSRDVFNTIALYDYAPERVSKERLAELLRWCIRHGKFPSTQGATNLKKSSSKIKYHCINSKCEWWDEERPRTQCQMHLTVKTMKKCRHRVEATYV